MNILMIHPHDLFDRSEPWTIRIRSIAREFEKRSHRVRLCYFPLTINEVHNPKYADSIEFIPLERRPSPKAFILNTIKLIKLSRWADVVHFQKCHHYSALPAVIAAYVTGRPLHYDWDDWEEKIWYESCGRGAHSRFVGILFKTLERWLPVLADSVSCSSAYLKELASRYGVKKDRIFDSPVGADLGRFRPDLSSQKVKNKYNIEGELVLYIGQLHGAQYADLFIKAANAVLHKRADVKFMIVGEGFLEDELRKMAKDLGMEEKVVFTGSVPHEEVGYYIASASVCVAPFRDTEVTRCKSPLKIAEYMASGKAIVASSVGEVRRMAGGVAMLADPGDHLSLAERILALLEDEKLRDNLGIYARRRVERRYNWAATAQKILSAYENICQKI